jgi:formate hydrogenlyase transcriptional activator
MITIEHGFGEARQDQRADFLVGGGEMGDRIRLHNWASTPLGPLSEWPTPLRTAVSLCVKSQFPIIIYWGWPDPIVLYNDACIPLAGEKHPGALGLQLFKLWPELRPTIEDVLESVLTAGKAAHCKDVLHFHRRSGFLEERYYTISFTPIVLECGKTGGCFCVTDDRTDCVIGERRLQTLRDLAARCAEATEPEEACRIAAEVLRGNGHDIPFALFYAEEKNGQSARLVSSVGLEPGSSASPRTIEFQTAETSNTWPLARVAATNQPLQVDNLEKKFGTLQGGPWIDSPKSALVLPIASTCTDDARAILVAGISPRAALDDAYRMFFDSITNEIGATIIRARLRKETSEQERNAKSEAELRKIVDAITICIGVVNPDGMIVYTNKTTRDYTGVSAEEAKGHDAPTRLYHPEDNERLIDARQKALLGVTPFMQERRVLGKDGQYRWFLMQYNPVFDDQGHVVRWYVTATDIDERVRAEETTRNENLILREQIERDSMYEDIVGSSPPLRGVLSQASKVASTDSTVLILGETGTGKELIARAIHKGSKRSSRAFIAVNCAAITPSLIASELFGHEKGAFTGAAQRRLGRFAAANGGTIFLDEIGDLPQEIQIALLRVLQEREIERVGSDRPIPVDVRVVVATHRDLNALVSEGRFRQDLLYRLNVVPIQMPSLRERAADIPLLVEYFVARFGSKAGKKFRTIDKRTLRLLQAYEWPGNVRELQNVIERAVILNDSDCFAVDETWLKREPSSLPRPTAALTGILLTQEKEMIEAALAQSRGRVYGPTGAAAKLGLPARSLDSKIERLKIDKYRFKSQRS